MSDHEDHTRDHGIEFGELKGALAGQDYPATASELVEAYGDRELGLPAGSEHFGTVLERTGAEEFQSATEVRDAVFNAVGVEAIGRPSYSDRDPPGVGETGHPIESV
ncbi:MAG: hypothetical protein ABEH81_15575 [Halopenitus sp.]